MNDEQPKQVEIPVLPVATISLSPTGDWFAEVVYVDPTDGKTGMMQITERNVVALLAHLRPKLQKNKAYFVNVANESFKDLQAKQEAVKPEGE